MCRLPREGPARPQAPPPTAPARERQVREGPHGERPHRTTVHRPEGGTGRPCLSNEAESLTALLGTATPCQGPGHRPGAMERAEQGPPPSPPQVRPVPQEVGSEVCVHSTRSWAGPGARGSSTGGGRCCMRLLVGTPAQETPVSGCARVTGPPRRPAGTEASRDAKSRSPGAQARARCGADARQHP